MFAGFLASLSQSVPYLIAIAAAVMNDPSMQAVLAKHPTATVVIGAIVAAILHRMPPAAK